MGLLCVLGLFIAGIVVSVQTKSDYDLCQDMKCDDLLDLICRSCLICNVTCGRNGGTHFSSTVGECLDQVCPKYQECIMKYEYMNCDDKIRAYNSSVFFTVLMSLILLVCIVIFILYLRRRI